MAYVITTVSGTTYLKDIGYRLPITHPATLDLTALGFTNADLDKSVDLQTALSGGFITALNNGVAVVAGSNINPPAKHQLSHTDGTDDIQTATGSQKGLISSTDWNTFNNKQTALSFTGTGNTVRDNSPTLITPNLGTPSAGVATNLTGIASGLTAGNANALSGAVLSTDGTLASNSDTNVPTEKAVKTYVTAAVTGLWDDRGSFSAAGGTFPTTGGSGTAGAVLKGDIWTISVAGTLGGTAVNVGDTIRALVDSPGQTAGNWAQAESNLGYTPVTNTRTVNGKALSADIVLALASADFANQGTTSTVLHGNAAGNPTFGSVVDADIGAHTSTKISITTKGQLNSAIVYNDQTNTFGAFNQLFKDANLRIVGSADATKVVTFDNSGQTTGTVTTIANLNTVSRTLQIPALTGTDTIATTGLAQTFTVAKTFNDSILQIRNPANTQSYTIRSSAITAARDLNLPLTLQTETLAVVPQITQRLPANPTGRASATAAMMGLAGSITPQVTGRLKIEVTGSVTSGSNGGGGTIQIRYGTGTAPTNAAALTGTAAGNPVIFDQGSANDRILFTCIGYVTGLTPGTAVWIDLSLASNGTGTTTVSSLTIIAEEK
jgi:hypothetical protein